MAEQKKTDWKTRSRTGLMLVTATGLFSGYFPVAPGTAGSLVGLVLVMGVARGGIVFHSLVTVALLIAGVWASEKANRFFRKADSSRIVIDEIVGIMVTMLGIPLSGHWLVAGFLLFRFFDIAKFPPANYFDERLKNGWGVMLDDVVAGIYSNVMLQLMIRTTV